MKIEQGATRYVVLFDKYAFKIAKINVVRAIGWLVFVLFSKHYRKLLQEKYEAGPVKSLVKVLFFGLVANRREYRYYKKYHDPRVIPCEKSYLFGLIIQQQRGSPITEEELAIEYPLDTAFILTPRSDVDTARQFCRDKTGRIVLVDYGGRVTVELLEATSKA